MDIDEYATYVKWSESQKVSSLPLLLQGRAKQIYQDLPPAAKSSWASVLSRLEESFGIDAATNILTFQKLDRIKGNDESVRDYAKDLLQRLRNAKITNDQHIMSCFFRGLLPNIRNQVIMMQPKSLSELEKFACIVELNITANGDSTAVAIQDAISQVTAGVTTRLTQDNAAEIHQNLSTDNRRVRFRSQSPGDNQRKRAPYQQDQRYNQQQTRPSSPHPFREESSHRLQQNQQYNNRQYSAQQSSQDARSQQQPRPAYREQRANNQNNRQQSQNQRQFAQRNPHPQPFCQQCDERHEWSHHTNPICSRCGTKGHAASECPQGF